MLEVAIEAAAKAVIEIKDSLDEWDSKVGDGDCGSTVSPLLLLVIYCWFPVIFWPVYVIFALPQMYRGAKAILDDIKK